MWIKNLCVYQSSQPFTWSSLELDELLKAARCPRISQQSPSVEGFVPPLKDHEALVLADEGLFLGMYQEVSRLLPGTVVKEELEARVEAIEAEQGRKPGRKERADLKDQITFELMPKAFTRSRRTAFLIDTIRHRVLVDAGTDTRAEQVVSMLRKAVGALPVKRPTATVSPNDMMTRWLKQPATLMAGFTLGDRAELQSSAEEKATARFSRLDLRREEILSLLDEEMQATKVNLVWNDEFEFDLTDALQLKRIRPLDLLQENLDHLKGDDALAELMARLKLQTGLLRPVLDRLYEMFQVELADEVRPA